MVRKKPGPQGKSVVSGEKLRPSHLDSSCASFYPDITS